MLSAEPGCPGPDFATRLGVIGWPVGHSRSPAIQNAALAAVGLRDWRYQLLPVVPELLAEVVAALPGSGFRGVNVTIPHKQAALALAGSATERAQRIGAANTLTFAPDGAVSADNTDAPALIASLGRPVAGATALVLGAGGSARAAVWALLDAGASEVRVWNRSPERARELGRAFGAVPVDAAAPADILVNCTAVGLDGSGSLQGLPLRADNVNEYGVVADLVYTSGETALVAAARARGVPAVGGLELLVGQGALSFERFTGRPAPWEAMRAAAGLGNPLAPRDP